MQVIHEPPSEITELDVKTLGRESEGRNLTVSLKSEDHKAIVEVPLNGEYNYANVYRE